MRHRTPGTTDVTDHDVWFHKEIEQAITEGDTPGAVWIPHEVVREDMRCQRQAIEARLSHTRATCAK